MQVNARVHMEIAVNPVPCGEISRVAFIGTCWQIDAARFRGRQDFEEIRYVKIFFLLCPSALDWLEH